LHQTTDEAPTVPNNPAGRVLAFLRPYEKRTKLEPNQSAMLVAAQLLGQENESPHAYLCLTRLRIQAVSVPILMAPHVGGFGYRAYDRHYPQILDAMTRLQTPSGQRATDIFTSVTDAGWNALEYADEVLNHHTGEVVLTEQQYADYIEKVRSVIDRVAKDETLSPSDRSRIVDLVRKVEQALLDVKINGSLPVQEAAAAAGVIVHAPGLWERVMGKTWVEGFFTTVGGLVLLVQGVDTGIAITQYVQGMIGS